MILDPCKFCGGTPSAPVDDQIEFNSWAASISCTGCDVTLTMQYGRDSARRAIDHIVDLWNSKPGAAA